MSCTIIQIQYGTMGDNYITIIIKKYFNYIYYISIYLLLIILMYDNFIIIGL